MEKENEIIEVDGVIFTPEMLESLRTLQANDNEQIKNHLERINWVIEDMIKLSSIADEMYLDSVHNAVYLIDIKELLSGFEARK